MSDDLKVGVSFPVSGKAREICSRVSKDLAGTAPVDIVLGDQGNSQPHVTIAMGTLPPSSLASLEDAVNELAGALGKAFDVSYGPIYREHDTGRYVFVDAKMPPEVLEWRIGAQARLADIFSEPARTSAVPHVTISCTDTPSDAMDRQIEKAPQVPRSTVSGIDIAYSGRKGAKLDVITYIPLA